MTARVAKAFRIRGVVQGVGFRPFVFTIAREHELTGWVANDADGVRIHAEGSELSLAEFTRDLRGRAPSAVSIDAICIADAVPGPFLTFSIETSSPGDSPTAGISPDIGLCDACLSEMLDSSDRRASYPYINCSACGPRFSIIEALPYDRTSTTMRAWEMCALCSAEFHDPADRRFHAQPIACPACGPAYILQDGTGIIARDNDAILKAAQQLNLGAIVAIKGIGGYHLACDAANAAAVHALRERKFRKEQPFALMVRDLGVARKTIGLAPDAEALLESSARPIVLGAAMLDLAGVADGTHEIGVMLPYTPLHHLLFRDGAPERLVMTSGNRSSEPISYQDAEASERLCGIADFFLVGERPIARRVDDSLVRIGAGGKCILRRSRGFSPRSVARMELEKPTLAVGADLKNSVTLVINGSAIMSQHIGDLAHLDATHAFRETIDDLLSMHGINREDLCVVHDLHPQYFSTLHALEIECAQRVAVQHHRAHIASVLAEREAFNCRVVGAAFDGTGYGEDGTIWGGEFFTGSILDGLDRVAHLRQFNLPGGDAAARFPVQAAAGLLTAAGFDDHDVLTREPFFFPDRYAKSVKIVAGNTRCFRSSSAGRLFDAVAALLGFVRESSYEGQAAAWLENLARKGKASLEIEFPFQDNELDFRAGILSIIQLRQRGAGVPDIARSFHRALATGISTALVTLSRPQSIGTAVLSGGVFQNDLLLADVFEMLEPSGMTVWTNNNVPPNDGGISLGQAASTLRSR